jgi:hypothetical protein
MMCAREKREPWPPIYVNAKFTSGSGNEDKASMVLKIEATGGELVEQFIERRTFLKAAFGIAAGVAAFAASVQAAPLVPPPVDSLKGKTPAPEPAVANQADLDNARVEEVRWGWHRRHWRRWHRRRYWGWRRRRYWGWRRRRYYYGFRRRRWHRRWYRRRYW